ncbi:MAG: NAD(P)H-hydrate dehydratase [Bacteroidales bacterium]|nr:NAD(P)H-hydrate dehydratase [Bacteroidales bacterium]
MITIGPAYLRPRLFHRPDETHKGDYGHLLVVAGCRTMPGAAVLAAGAALRSGCGLVTLHSTERALQAMVVRDPSAMLSEDPGDCFSLVPESMDRYSAVAVGPGLGRRPETKEALLTLLSAVRERKIPAVMDADALNILSEMPDWQECVPGGAVLTPHLGELRRLLSWSDDDERDCRVRALCAETGCTLIMKGFHTKVFIPTGDCLVNATGNPGLAKGGSGDVLTGLLGGLLARGYAPADAAALAVWLHGRAGDILTQERTAEAYSSQELIDNLHQGFKELYTF